MALKTTLAFELNLITDLLSLKLAQQLINWWSKNVKIHLYAIIFFSLVCYKIEIKQRYWAIQTAKIIYFHLLCTVKKCTLHPRAPFGVLFNSFIQDIVTLFLVLWLTIIHKIYFCHIFKKSYQYLCTMGREL